MIQWRKSSHSAHEGGECVEVADLTHAIAVRDSKNPTGPMLVVDRAAFRTLAHQIQTGHHEV